MLEGRGATRRRTGRLASARAEGRSGLVVGAGGEVDRVSLFAVDSGEVW